MKYIARSLYYMMDGVDKSFSSVVVLLTLKRRLAVRYVIYRFYPAKKGMRGEESVLMVLLPSEYEMQIGDKDQSPEFIRGNRSHTCRHPGKIDWIHLVASRSVVGLQNGIPVRELEINCPFDFPIYPNWRT